METHSRRSAFGSLAYVVGLLMTSCGLASLAAFVLYEFMHVQEMGDNVAQVVFGGIGGMALVLLGFATMVVGSPGGGADDDAEGTR